MLSNKNGNNNVNNDDHFENIDYYYHNNSSHFQSPDNLNSVIHANTSMPVRNKTAKIIAAQAGNPFAATRISCRLIVDWIKTENKTYPSKTVCHALVHRGKLYFPSKYTVQQPNITGAMETNVYCMAHEPGYNRRGRHTTQPN